jgi:preprotein translocase subunit SecG
MLMLIGFYVLLVIYFFACLFLILVILAQEGKGGGLSGLAGASAIGETFGFGAASTALRKWTRNAAIAFVVLTIALTFYGEQIARSRAEKFLMGGDGATAAVAPAEAPSQAVQKSEGQNQATTTAQPKPAQSPAPLAPKPSSSQSSE